MAQRAAVICGLIIALAYASVIQQRWQKSVAPQNNTVNDIGVAQIQLLDVGQGDAIHIRSTTGRDVLIDGGPDATVVERLGTVLPFWDRTIELMVLSHPDADHITGLISVFDYYAVAQLVLVDLPVQTPLHKELLRRAQSQGTNIIYVRAGQHIALSHNEKLEVLYPLTSTPVAERPTNDTSIVLLYTFTRPAGLPHTTFLTSGDAAETVENELVAAGLIPDVDILKVGHHGSASSSSVAYIAAAQPEYAAISVGAENDYGHPTPAALNRLATTSEILRTDQVGTITFQLDEAGYSYVE